MRRFFIPALSALLLGPAFAANGVPAPDDLYAGWMKMYDLRFDEAHQLVGRWAKSNPSDALAPASQAAGYLFAELARLGALESELFVDDHRFKERSRLQPDPQAKRLFLDQIGSTERLADATLQHAPDDQHALFAKSISLGLQG